MDNYFDKYDLKADFIKATKGKSNFKYVFSLCYEKEVDLSLDICEFTFEQFTDLISYLLNGKGKEVDTLVTFISDLENYLDYCARQWVSILNRDIIDENINKEFKSKKRWILSLADEELDYSYNFLKLDDLIKLEGTNLFSYQDLALFWLFFIGLKKSEVINFQSKDVTSWKIKFRDGIKLPNSILEKVSQILITANNEIGFEKNDRYGSPYFIKYKNLQYLIRSSESTNMPVTNNILYEKFDRLEKYLYKSRLKEKNIRKSGMLYFGSEILKSRTIRDFPELKEVVYRPICLTFGESETSYRVTLDKIFNNVVLKKFYDIELPENIKRRNKVPKSNVLSISRLPNTPPKARESSDKEVWEKNQQDGYNGELIVREFLKTTYSEVFLVKDYYGYDIYANNGNEYRFVEVKTMNNKRCLINITKHEYRVANVLDNIDHYWFYILIWDSSDKSNGTPELYIFKDFLGKLGIRDMEDILFKKENLPDDNSAMWSHQDFSLQLSESIFKKCDGYVEINECYNILDTYKES